MKITNLAGLPAPIVEAVKNDDYSRGAADISVTQLLDPVQKVTLYERHHETLTVDASDKIFALMGKLGHKVLEQSTYGALAEERFSAPVGDWVLSGGTDHLYLEQLPGNTWGLDDYKFTTMWTFKERRPGERSRLDDYEMQLQILRWLLWKNGINVTRLRVIALLRDWSKMEAKRNPDIPQQQVAIREFIPRNVHEVEKLIEMKVRMHMGARDLPDDQLPECSAEDRWAKPPQFRVEKKGRASALKVEPTYDSAVAWMVQKKLAVVGADGTPSLAKDHSIVRRAGEDTRCEFYCEVKDVCAQYSKIRGTPTDDEAPFDGDREGTQPVRNAGGDGQD